MKELTDLVDFIIKNGYKVNILDFRYTLSNGNVLISGRTEALEHSLKNICIFKEDSTDKTITYLRDKVKDLNELLSIKDNSIFNQDMVKLEEYIKLK